ncbi:E3 ubiquitin/ISG15 ligase TRIM25-like isoform X2 [Rhinatrema bivittatum]|uniref:E3 ubiquitin/ISG15 ligase TRIM25-like isoform X2 n=1 Tax=Rhinatrema bivittatum TaxID=194408 RepID=UPI00112795D2|nr:E3 ubiquitin/ISG15 ligase TRIM25-like isoform X2 [Rhinatrema bivittatum]
MSRISTTVSLQLSKDRLLCSICLDVFQDPVSLICGHNFCQTCINDHWFKKQHWSRYQCPMCRKEFSSKPYPEKNALLGDIAEEFRRAQRSAIPPPLLPTDVPCDWCPAAAQRKAVKSCLRCLASFCQAHLQPHRQAEGAFADHPLEEPLPDLLSARKCPAHGRLVELYCRQERRLLCSLCAFGEPAGHAPILLEEEARGRKVDIAAVQMEEKKRLKEADRNREEVRKYMEDVKHRALVRELHASKISELIKVLEGLRKDAEDYFKREEDLALEEIFGCLKEMKEENMLIRMKIALLQDLEESCDHFRVVQESEGLKADTGPLVSPLLKVDSVNRMQCVDRMLSQLLDGIEKTLEDSVIRKLLQNCAALRESLPELAPSDDITRSMEGGTREGGTAIQLQLSSSLLETALGRNPDGEATSLSPVEFLEKERRIEAMQAVVSPEPLTAHEGSEMFQLPPKPAIVTLDKLWDLVASLAGLVKKSEQKLFETGIGSTLHKP